MKADSNGYKEAASDYASRWALQDEVLYDLCRRFPGHSKRAAVNAKVCLIGRTYQTGLERKVASAGGQGSALDTITAHIHKHHQKLDAILDTVRHLEEPLTEAKLSPIVVAHGRFDAVVAEARINGASARSFVAKYMHFHAPIVPIYDDFAAKGARKRIRWRRDLEVIPCSAQTDEQYWRFVLRFWRLYSTLRGQPTVRHLDRFLVDIGESSS
jgi:hypothetical protein